MSGDKGSEVFTNSKNGYVLCCEHSAIALAISWSGIIALTLLLFRVGVSVGPWHAVGWIAGYFALLGWFTWNNRREKGVRYAIGLGFLHGTPLLLIALGAVWMQGLTTDFSVDGISTHQDPVVAMMQGWNPVKDPFFEEAYSKVLKDGAVPELVFGSAQRGCALSFSSITSAIIGFCTGEHESGKAINLMVLPMVFGFALGCSRRMGVSSPIGFFWSIAVAANPVILYQTASFLQDGLVSAFYGCLLLYAFSWLNGKVPRSSIWICTCLGFVLSGLKLSGMGYAIISLGFLGLGGWYLKRSSFWILALWGLLSILLLLWAGESSRFWQITSRFSGVISDRVTDFSSERVVEGGGGFGQVEGLSKRPKLMQFILSHGSLTHASPTTIDFKMPFTIRSEELKVFYDLTGEPRAGGFGPLGSGIMLLCLGAGASLFWVPKRFALGILFVGLMALVPLAWVPVFWARWIGHVWVFLFLVGLPLLVQRSCRNGSSTQRLPLLRLFPVSQLGAFFVRGMIATACLNALFVWIPYVSGHVVAGRILRSQLEVIQKLEQPVTAYIGWSRACRFWMIREGIAFNRDYPSGVPSSRLFRAETRVFLSDESMEKPFDSKQTIRGRLLEIQEMSMRLQPGQFYAEIVFFPDDA